MKHLIVWTLVAQFSFSALAQGLGEKESSGQSPKVIPVLLAGEAMRFHETIEKEMKELESTSVENYILKSGIAPQSELASLVKKMGSDVKRSIAFKSKKSGQWEMVLSGQRLVFSSADAFKERIFINEKEFNFRGKSLAEIFSEIQTMQEKKTVSLIDLFIQPAHAVLPIVYAIAAVVAIVLIGKALLTYRDRTKLVDGLNQLKEKFKTDANRCENDGNNGEFLNQYFSSSNTSLMRINRNVSAAERALRSEMMSQASDGTKNELDCYKALTHGLRAAGHEVRAFTTEELYNRREGLHMARGVQQADVRSRIFDVCDSYNSLVNCVDTQVLHFVNNRRENYKLSSEVREVVESRRSSGATQR